MASYDAIVLASSPLAYYRLDETSGSAAADASGNGHGLTYGSSVALGAGPLASSVRGGVTLGTANAQANAIYSAGRVSALEPTAAITVEAWMKFTSVTSIPQEALCYGTTGSFLNYAIYPNVGVWNFGANIGGTRYTLSGGTAAQAGTLYHVVGVYDGTAMYLYVNGSLLASTAITGALSNYGASGNNGLTLGSNAIFSYDFAGTLAAVAIYGTALSPATIGLHYLTGLSAYLGPVDAVSGANYQGSVTLTWPNGQPQPGDVILATAVGQSHYLVVPPPGFLALYSDASNFGTGLWWKPVIGSPDPATVTWTDFQPNNLAVSMVRISGASINVAPQWSAASGGTALSLATTPITPSALGALVVALYCAAQNKSSFSASGTLQTSTTNLNYTAMIETFATLTSDTVTPISVTESLSTTPNAVYAYEVILAPLGATDTVQALTALALVSLPLTAGATTPTASVGALAWSTTASTIMQFNGSSWQAAGTNSLIPTDVASGVTFDVAVGTQQFMPAALTIEGTILVEGTLGVI